MLLNELTYSYVFFFLQCGRGRYGGENYRGNTSQQEDQGQHRTTLAHAPDRRAVLPGSHDPVLDRLARTAVL